MALWRSPPLQARDGLPGKLLSVELRCGSTGSELVHPELRLRRLADPACVFAVNQVDVPRISGQAEAPGVTPHQPATLVPIVTAPRVADEARRLGDIAFGATALRNPDDVRTEVGRLRFLEQILLDFGGPPKTGASSR